MSEDIILNIKTITERIVKACVLSGRDQSEVKLLLATKTVPADRIKVALAAGQTLIAENKVQELKEKYEALNEMPHNNHFIGHLQTNKIKDLLKHGVSCIQSLDRLDLAEKLHQRLLFENKTMEVSVYSSCSEVELMLFKCPLVQEACIISSRDAYRGETVKAVVVLRAEARASARPEDIIAWAREHMAAYKVPQVVEVVESLPKSATGKVQWRASWLR